jgi:glutamate dehydrogenase/leucine dehydrogenase
MTTKLQTKALLLEDLKRYEEKEPELILRWKDDQTEAKGWLVINSLRGGAAGGGTRMKKGIDLQEVSLLAKTMEIKFTVSGPRIGGAKSGIDFDPLNPRKRDVLRRWFKAVSPMLKTYHGTGGDLNVDFINEITPLTQALGILHPQEGILEGHFSGNHKAQKAACLSEFISKIVQDPKYSPDQNGNFTITDLISGYSVAE